MKAFFSTLLLAVLPLAGATLTQSERETVLTLLTKSSKIVLNSLEGVSDTQWNYKPSGDRWSVQECAEHIAITDEMMFLFASQQLMKIPPPAGAKHQEDAEILRAAVDREHKVKTQPFLEPKGKYPTKAAVIEAFEKTRARIAEYVKTTQDDLRGHGFQGPNGYVDGYQFLLTLAGHAERHSQQIAEVKGTAGYPKQ